MSFGFEVSSESGVVAGSDFLGYSLIQETTVRITDDEPTYLPLPSEAMISDSPPIIAVELVEMGDKWINLCRVLGSPRNWRSCLFVGGYLENRGSRTYRVRVYVAGVTSKDSFGIRLINDSNKTTFDSGFKQLEFDSSTRLTPNWDSFLKGDGPAGGGYWLTWHGVLGTLHVGDKAWVPLNLSHIELTTTMESNASGKWGTYAMEVSISPVIKFGKLSIVMQMLSSYRALNYSFLFNTYCPIIKE